MKQPKTSVKMEQREYTPSTECDSDAKFVSLLRSVFDNVELLQNGLPGALVTALVLAVHELGHNLVAKEAGLKLGVPFLVPSFQVRFNAFLNAH